MKQSEPGPHAREELGRARPFSRMGSDVLDRIFSHMHERRFEPGERLMRQGEDGDCLLVLLEGSAKVLVCDPEGETHQVGQAGAGEALGELALLTREKRTADVVADGPVRALALLARDFEAVAVRHPELGILLTHLVGQRLGQTARDGLGGKEVHGYRIRRCVGRGGMAIVYEAVQLATGRKVALKMMSHRLLYEPEMLERFRREAEIAATLKHDNVAELLDRFSAYNTQFLVIEFCDGPTLRDFLKHHGPLPEPETRAIVGQLARALDYIHSRGVIHRDLKPANAMLMQDGTVKLMDFGLARPRVKPDVTLTQPGIPIGTPVYMPPEQLFAEGLDARADIYALACIAFELVAGRPLFGAMGFRELTAEKLAPHLPAAADLGRGIGAALYEFIERGVRTCKQDRLDKLETAKAWAAPVSPARVAPLLDDAG